MPRTNKFTNFPASYNEAFDTLYELWIIFEIMNYLEEKGMRFIAILDDRDKFAGFKIQSNDVIFNLQYQNKCVGWTKSVSNPDFTIQIEKF